MRPRLAERLGLSGILLLGFALRVYHLGADSLWYDETVSALLARKSLAAMWAHTALDIHPPLYYALLHGWRVGAGGSEFSLAFFSLWFSVAGIALTASLGRRLFGPGTGLLAAFLAAINPFGIWYAQEVRMYTLGLFLTLLLLKFVLDFLHSRQRFSGALVGYALVAALLLWTLYYAAFTLMALNLVLIPWLWRRWPRQLGPWLAAQVAALLLYLPWLPHALHQALHPPVPPWRESLTLGPLLLRVAREGSTALALGQSIDAGRWWLVGALALAAGAGALRPGGQRGRVGLLWALLLGPLLIILFISQTITPLYHVRYLNVYSGPWPLLVAAGLAALWERGKLPGQVLSAGLLGLLLLGSGLSLRNYHTQRFQYEAADDLRGAIAALDDHLGPNDAILIDAGYLYPAFSYYWPGTVGWMGRLDDDPPAVPVQAGPVVALAGFVDGAPDIGWGDPSSDFYAISQQRTEAQLSQLFREHNMVWLLRGYDTVNDPNGVIRAWLENNAQLIYDQAFAGQTYVRVQGWQQAPLAPAIGLSVAFEDNIHLLGYDMVPIPPQPHQPLRLTLHWQATATPERSYKIFVHWLTADWQKIAQADLLPGFGALPTSSWPAGQPISSNFVLRAPAQLASGSYRIIAGLYDAETGAPLPLLSGETQVVLWEGP